MRHVGAMYSPGQASLYAPRPPQQYLVERTLGRAYYQPPPTQYASTTAAWNVSQVVKGPMQVGAAYSAPFAPAKPELPQWLYRVQHAAPGKAWIDVDKPLANLADLCALVRAHNLPPANWLRVLYFEQQYEKLGVPKPPLRLPQLYPGTGVLLVNGKVYALKSVQFLGPVHAYLSAHCPIAPKTFLRPQVVKGPMQVGAAYAAPAPPYGLGMYRAPFAAPPPSQRAALQPNADQRGLGLPDMYRLYDLQNNVLTAGSFKDVCKKILGFTATAPFLFFKLEIPSGAAYWGIPSQLWELMNCGADR